MPAKQPSGAVSAAEVDAKLPRAVLVRRGHIREAFGLSEEEMRAFVPDVFHPVTLNLAPNKRRKQAKKRTGPRAYFLRSQVLGVARRWEEAG